ncbi:cytochrome P450 [Lentzea sp. BCCO 10_0798]|uniref:Cytochrome P450 n=1 Tax=Lentzea kristufekii TaxID=3095430 RepID=A0ABU4U571_9PSEU|nr:cytochrome P450 [Lentzea sp. BCCO 10_0798]MDX8055661.1 cytochrome P450 [Lentzea sp. BCCO 10_0798]
MSVPVAPGRLPFLGHSLPMLRKRFAFTRNLRGQGDLVEVHLGPMRTYFVASPKLTHQVLVADAPKFHKGRMYDKFRPFVGNGLAVSSGAFHLRQRRMMQPAFHRDRIAGYASTMLRATLDLLDGWRPGEVRQLEADMQGLAVTIVGEALFSTEIGKKAIAEARRSVFVIIRNGILRALSPAFVEKLPIPANREFDEAISRMRAIVREVIESRRGDETDHGDLLSTLLMARDAETGEPMTEEQVFDEVITLLTAGIETTALALAWIFHEIAANPEVERRVVAEVDEVLAGRPVTVDDVPKLTYVGQVATEVLRKYPLWLVMRRTAVEVELGGAVLPAGTEVILSPHTMHHDPANFPDPERFDPDRWTPERAKRLPKGAFVPFGGGIHQCIGNHFALTEIAIVVATVCARYRLVPDRPVRTKFTNAAYPNDLMMKVVPR